MKPCVSCPWLCDCRVPNDLARFDKVMHRLDEQHRNPLLRDRLHHYLQSERCLVEAGCVTLC